MTARTDPLWRRWAAGVHRTLVNARASGMPPAESAGGPRLWYGGARPGQAGGPALKLAKLQAVFPETKNAANIAYLVSAAPYLWAGTLDRLRRKGIRTVLNQNGVFYPAWFAGDWRARNRRMAVAHAMADHVLYQSDFCRRAALRFLGERQGDGEILYNAVDTQRFAPAEEAPPAPFTFLVTGKIDAHQAYRVTRAVEGFVQARAQGLEAALIVAGVVENSVLDQARAIAERAGLAHAILFAGPYSQAQAPRLYREAHAYVTLTHQDACPSGVIEALASGLPVIHPTSGGVPELTGEAGIALPTGEDWQKPLIPETGAVAEAMLRAAAAHAGLSHIARQRAVSLFDIQVWLERHAALFASLLERHD